MSESLECLCLLIHILNRISLLFLNVYHLNSKFIVAQEVFPQVHIPKATLPQIRDFLEVLKVRLKIK